MPPAPPRENSALVTNQRCCFRKKFWNREIWPFHFLVVREDQFCTVIWGWGWYFGDADDCPAIRCQIAGYPSVQVIVHGLDTEVVPVLVSSEGACKQRTFQLFQVLFPPFSVLLLLFSQGGGGVPEIGLQLRAH